MTERRPESPQPAAEPVAAGSNQASGPPGGTVRLDRRAPGAWPGPSWPPAVPVAALMLALFGIYAHTADVVEEVAALSGDTAAD